MDNPLSALLTAQIEIAGSAILWREIIGNAFGLAGAILGMRRNVWTWPVGIIGNVLLFTVFLGAVFETPQDTNLYGQAGRQVFFFLVSIYGWSVWLRARRESGPGKPAVHPRWATWRERAGLAVVAVAGVAVAYVVFGALGTWGGPVQRVGDAWIFVGSMLATYGMARGWTDFWVLWLLVDVVGIPLLLQAGFYPSAVLYAVYGGFVVWGLVVWLRASRGEDDPEISVREETAAAAT